MAGVGAALWIFRHERAENRKLQATQSEQVERAQTAQRQQHDKDQAEQADLRARDIRRAKYQEDYRAIGSLLEQSGAAGYRVRISGPWLRGEAAESGVLDLQDELERYADRVPTLQLPLLMLGHAIWQISSNVVPDGTDRALVEIVTAVTRQHAVIQDIDEAVKRAKAALDSEWEA